MKKRNVEIFTAGCPLCEDLVAQVNELACASCEISVHDLTADKASVERAREVGVTRVPAVVVDGALSQCCTGKTPTDSALLAEGIGSLR